MDTRRAWIKETVFIAIALAALAWAAVQVKSYRFIGSNPNLNRSITVTGEGKVSIRADVATVQMTVSSESGPRDLAAVQDTNSKRANDVIAFVKSEGVKAEDVKTLNYSIQPRYNYSQSGQQFLGYTIRQDIQVKIRDLAKVGTILNGAVGHGANEVSGLQFTVDDEAKPEEEARNKAIEDAKAKAARLADELGVKLARITSYSESGGGVPPIFYREDMAYGKGGAGGGPSPSIEPGQNEVRSNVTITYEIE